MESGLKAVFAGGYFDYGRDAALLLEAYPLDRDPPYDAFMSDRLLIHRHMRLAFEEDDSWLVELLEAERAQVAAQAAYAMALEREAGLRPEEE